MRQYKITVFRSLRHFSAQMVDLKTGDTLFGVIGKDASTLAKDFTALAKKKKIAKCFFDRTPRQARGKRNYRYSGKIKIFIETCRENGLEL